MNKNLGSRMRFLHQVVLLLLCIAAAPLQAQTVDSANGCRQPTDPNVVFQEELCAAHAGCALVVKINKTCVAVQQFYEKLSASIGAGVKTLFGFRKEVQDKDVWEAVQTDTSRQLDTSPAFLANRDLVLGNQDSKRKDFLKLRNEDGVERVYVGDVADGKPNGYGVRYGSDGNITRGQWSDGQANGIADSIKSDGNGKATREIGQFVDDGLLNGTRILQDGQRFEGSFNTNSGELIAGSKFGPDGHLVEKGIFKNDALYIGEKFLDGTSSTHISVPSDDMKIAEADQAQELDRIQRIKDKEAEDAENDRRAKLAAQELFISQLGSMNAGQLYSLADELNASGDATKAREALRTLLNRFPDHALAVEAAKQLTLLGPATAPVSGAPAGKRMVSDKKPAAAGADCEASFLAMSAEFQKLQSAPISSTIPALQRVIYMTSKSLALGNGACKGSAHEAELTAGMQAALDSAMTTCQQLSSDSSLCAVP